MANVSGAPAKGKWGRRSMDTPINLVPYIDLMTTIITFLMMTAVWTQLASLEVQNGMAGKETPPPAAIAEPVKAVIVSLTASAIEILEEGREPMIIPKVGDSYDFKVLKDELKGISDSHANLVELKLRSEDGVQYHNIIKVLDAAAGVGLKAFTIRPMA